MLKYSAFFLIFSFFFGINTDFVFAAEQPQTKKRRRSPEEKYNAAHERYLKVLAKEEPASKLEKLALYRKNLREYFLTLQREFESKNEKSFLNLVLSRKAYYDEFIQLEYNHSYKKFIENLTEALKVNEPSYAKTCLENFSDDELDLFATVALHSNLDSVCERESVTQELFDAKMCSNQFKTYIDEEYNLALLRNAFQEMSKVNLNDDQLGLTADRKFSLPQGETRYIVHFEDIKPVSHYFYFKPRPGDTQIPQIGEGHFWAHPFYFAGGEDLREIYEKNTAVFDFFRKSPTGGMRFKINIKEVVNGDDLKKLNLDPYGLYKRFNNGSYDFDGPNEQD